MIPFSLILVTLCSALTLAAGQGTLIADATVNIADPNLRGTNFGSLPQLQLSRTTLVALRFSLDGLPFGTADTNIRKATLRLYVNRVSVPGTAVFYRNDPNWSESAITLATLPASFVPPTAAVPVNTANAFLTVDVTEQVREVLRAGGKFFSGVIASSAEAFLDSKENIATSQPPQLDIQLAGPAGPRGITGLSGSPGPKGDKGDPGSADVPGNFSTFQVADFSVATNEISQQSLSCPAAYPQLVSGGCGFPFLAGTASAYAAFKRYYSGPDPDNSNGAWRCITYNGALASQTMRIYINCAK